MKKIRVILKVLIVLVDITLIFNGIVWGFFPTSNFDTYKISVDTIDGLNMIKSDIGGPLIIAGVFSLIYVIKGERWFYPTLLIAFSYLTIRTFSLIVDGYAQTAFVGVVIEVIFIVILVLHETLSRNKI